MAKLHLVEQINVQNLTELRLLLVASQESLPYPSSFVLEEARRKLKWIMSPLQKERILGRRGFDGKGARRMSS